MTNTESNVIRILRITAMVAIVTCHFLQAYGSVWRLIFNIGVQAFFVLSGFLYGNKVISNFKQWYIRRIIKIYIPYMLLFLLLLPLWYYVHNPLNIKSILFFGLNLGGLRHVFEGVWIAGFQHTWFLTAIMFAYFALPLLQYVASKINANYVIWLLVIMVAILYLFFSTKITFLASWVYLFALGYFFARVRKNTQYIFLSICLIILIAELLLSSKTSFLEQGVSYWLIHDLVGILWVLGGYSIMKLIKLESIPQLLTLLDKYSFHIYLVHFIFLVGPFAIINVTSYKVLNVGIALCCIAISTILFVIVVNIVERFINKNKWVQKS